jgi:glycosyltransferase involved in cell wall biosynthesis
MPVRISVITAVYNRVATVAQAIESVRRQSWPHVEHVVIDGGSTDGTLEVLNRFKAGFGVIVSERDRGIYDALNKGLARATGDAVGFLHSDDFFATPTVLERVANAFAGGADIVFGDLDYVDMDDVAKVIRRWRCGAYSKGRLAKGWMPPHPTFYVRQSLIEQLGGFDLSMTLAADYDFMLRYLLHAGDKSAYVPDVLVKMRTGGASNRSFAALLQNARENMAALRKNNMASVGTLVLNKLRKLHQFL